MPKPRGTQARSESATNNPRKSGIIAPLLLITFILGAIGYGWHVAKNSTVAIDETTLCATDRPPSSVHVILIDVSDQLSILAQEEVTQEIERIQAKLQQLDRLEIYGLGIDESGATRALFAACNPGRGKDMNALYQNPELAEKRWNRDFRQAISAKLNAIINSGESDQSLILEAIRGISVRTFGRPDFDFSKKYLYVFSDLLQNNPGSYTHYSRPLLSYDAFLASGLHASAQSNLTGVEVEFYYLSPPEVRPLQNAEHLRFWETYVNRSGGSFGPRPVTRILGGE